MVMLDGRWHRGRRTQLAVEVKWVAAFVNAPPVVFAAPDEVRRFPKVLPIVACPDLAGFAVDRQPPRIAQAVSPVFRSRIFPSHKGVVLGHGVSLGSIRVIDI